MILVRPDDGSKQGDVDTMGAIGFLIFTLGLVGSLIAYERYCERE